MTLLLRWMACVLSVMVPVDGYFQGVPLMLQPLVTQPAVHVRTAPIPPLVHGGVRERRLPMTALRGVHVTAPRVVGHAPALLSQYSDRKRRAIPKGLFELPKITRQSTSADGHNHVSSAFASPGQHTVLGACMLAFTFLVAAGTCWARKVFHKGGMSAIRSDTDVTVSVPVTACEKLAVAAFAGESATRPLPRRVIRRFRAVQTNASDLSPVFETIRNAQVVDPINGTAGPILASPEKKKSLVVILPQLGEFDSSELCEQLAAIQPELSKKDIELQVIGIGETACANEFANFTGLPLTHLKVDPNASLHKALNLHTGPNWDVPDFISDDVLAFLLNTLPGGVPNDPNLLRPAARAWLNYLAMCAGIGAPGTLPEILRGYFGDLSAPERFAADDLVTAGFIKIGPGVGPVQLGPLSYSQWWANERGYQRPIELATVRLKNMVEVLTKWDTYVTNPTTIDQRGATFIFSETGEILYEYRHRGVLTYSETMSRPLTFLAPYIGENLAENPLGLPDAEQRNTHGRGLLKPAGIFMSFLGPLFAAENTLQARILGAEAEDLRAARNNIEKTIASNHVVVYTYGLSPFSTEAMALLKDAGCSNVKQIELGPEWFLLGKEASAMRAELLAMTGQSSLPQVFIGGKHIGGIFSGKPGLAELQESGSLQSLLLDKQASS